jgi:hypothetical protein
MDRVGGGREQEDPGCGVRRDESFQQASAQGATSEDMQKQGLVRPGTGFDNMGSWDTSTQEPVFLGPKMIDIALRSIKETPACCWSQLRRFALSTSFHASIPYFHYAMSGSGGFYKYPCKYFLNGCGGWTYVNNDPCEYCLVCICLVPFRFNSNNTE